MFLYDKKSNVIDVYNLKSNPQDLEDYRKEKMKLIPEYQRFFWAKQVSEDKEEIPLFERVEDELDNHFISYAIADRKAPFDKSYHLILPEYDLDGKDTLIDDYYKGNFTDRKTAVILYSDFKYYLLTDKRYNRRTNNNYTYHMKDIIQIPRILYGLQLLQQEKYDLFLKQDINHDELLSLFKKIKLGEITEEDLLNIDRFGITENAYNKVLTKAKRDESLSNRLK